MESSPKNSSSLLLMFRKVIIFIVGPFISFLVAFFYTRWDLAYTPPPNNKYGGLAEIITIPFNGQNHVVTIRTNLNITNTTSSSGKSYFDHTLSHDGESLELSNNGVVTTNDNINSIQQRQKDIPILLIIHGGPGASDIPNILQTDNMLEDHFVVVHYDQRTSSKSCKYYEQQQQQGLKYDNINVFTIEQHINDAIEMIHYLRQRFQQDKIYVLGGSWGSILTLLLARDIPQYIHKIAVRGLCVNVTQSEILSYNFVAQTFPNSDFTKQIPQLPPYGSKRVNDMIKQRKWLKLAGGMSYKCYSTKKCTKLSLEFDIIKTLLQSNEMSWNDLSRFKRCFIRTLHNMWDEVEQFDAIRDVPQIDIPIVILHGKYDYTTSHTLVETYIYHNLIAPKKTLHWFYSSGHSPHIEESKLFQQILIKELLKK